MEPTPLQTCMRLNRALAQQRDLALALWLMDRQRREWLERLVYKALGMMEPADEEDMSVYSELHEYLI